MCHLSRLIIVALLAALISFGLPARAAQIVGISTPIGSNNGTSRSLTDNVWSVTGMPAPTNSGIGWMIDTTESSDYASTNFVKHDNIYSPPNWSIYAAPYVPDPARAQVTFTFSSAIVLESVRILEHFSGVTKVQAFIGNSPSTMTEIGDVFGSQGDLTTYFAANGTINDFDFSARAKAVRYESDWIPRRG